jgi:hypothetical protein
VISHTRPIRAKLRKKSKSFSAEHAETDHLNSLTAIWQDEFTLSALHCNHHQGKPSPVSQSNSMPWEKIRATQIQAP